MKQLYLDIKARIRDFVPEVLFIAVYNNQLESIEAQEIYSFQFPAVFIEIVSESPAEQLGNGVQIFDPLYIRIHIAHTFYNGDNQEENLAIFDLKQNVYKALQKFEPDRAVAFIRTGEEQDTDHTDLYHFIQTYVTNYVDFDMQEPVNGIVVNPPFNLNLTIDFDKQ